jgi:hypothetical protein
MERSENCQRIVKIGNGSSEGEKDGKLRKHGRERK